MERIVTIGEKQVCFKATAATPVRYRKTFGKDIMVELMNQNGAEFNNFEALENLAYIMAGEETLGISIEEWLDQFELTDFYAALEQVLDLWNSSQAVTSGDSSKNAKAADL